MEQNLYEKAQKCLLAESNIKLIQALYAHINHREPFYRHKDSFPLCVAVPNTVLDKANQIREYLIDNRDCSPGRILIVMDERQNYYAHFLIYGGMNGHGRTAQYMHKLSSIIGDLNCEFESGEIHKFEYDSPDDLWVASVVMSL